MTLRTVTIDTPVWIRDTFIIDIPDDCDDTAQFIDDAVSDGREPETSEELDNVYGMSRQIAVDGEDLN